MKKLAISLVVAGGLFTAGAANATTVTYEYSFSAADMMSYAFVNGADGTRAPENGLYDGARQVNGWNAAGGPTKSNTYVQSSHSTFTDWATTTTHTLNSFNLWGFDGLGAGWGEDYKHLDSLIVSSAAGWETYDAGWDPGWGTNPNPNTFVSPGWFVENDDASNGYGFGDAGLAAEVFTFRLAFDDTDYLYGEDVSGAPQNLGGDMTFWFGGSMGDNSNGPDSVYQYQYEGNMVLTGVRVNNIPEPATLALFGLGLAGAGAMRRKKKHIAA